MWWIIIKSFNDYYYDNGNIDNDDNKINSDDSGGMMIINSDDSVFNILLLDFLKRMCSYVGPGPWEKMDFFNIIWLIWQVNK
jgi:hypothetical protein